VAFNSVVFLVLFLPVSLAGYYILARSRNPQWRLLFLIAAGLAFYGRSQAYYVPLLLGSILGNHALATGIHRSATRPSRKRFLLTCGVLANIGLLLYFKYFSAVFNTAAQAFGHSGSLLEIVTPLAISFFTFQQVAFLVDVARGRTTPGPLLEYTAFVSFFPQLLAGPISLHQEVAPQLARKPARSRALENILVGLTIFALGLFKKTVVADTLALWANPLFDGAAAGSDPGLVAAWAGAVTYTLQIYFDFSGYSDMAMGVARMFGVLLPLNFFSPFRSRSIAELWQRWHMTLGRWVRLYIFQPIAIPLTRLAARLELGRRSAHAVTTLLPTFLAMLIIGAWHGPSWTYVVFGVMHGTFMCINEIYSFYTRKKRRKKQDAPAMLAFYTFLTVLAFTLAEVPFRSSDVPTAMRVFAGMAGMNGSGLDGGWLPIDTLLNLALIAVATAFVYLLPNTQQIMTRVTPALEWDRWKHVDPARLPLTFQFSLGWCLCTALVLALGFVCITRGTPMFIYFNF
jgi:alginate O-acetyltransferase complex protein AlgI